MDLKTRNRQPELMDEPDLDGRIHAEALAGLRRVNRLSRTDAVLWETIRRLSPPAGRPLTILDIASGGGDLAIQLARRCARSGISVEIEGCDISPTAVEYAGMNARIAGVGNVRFTQRDILTEAMTPDSYDVVMCTLFLHHLSESDAFRLLEIMKRAARLAVVVDDLRRTAMGYWMAWLGTRLLTRCHVVHVDGPLSVEGAFTVDEVQRLARQAGLENVSISCHWPQRFLLTSLQEAGVQSTRPTAHTVVPPPAMHRIASSAKPTRAGDQR
ncbi:MAG: methyltransferase domain-containing protein [Planctomycetaceae bacterium]|nr:methyltransferase domain-containing protein [Planctomycetaceae bacterium]